MNDAVITVLAIFIGGVLMFVFPLIDTAERNDDITQQLVQTETTEFVNNIISTGKLTNDKYEAFVYTISSTGNSYNVDIQIAVLDENANKKTSQASSSKVGENDYYTIYTTQVLEALDKNGDIDLKPGDQFFTRVINDNQTIDQILKNFIFKVTGNGNAAIVAQYSGIVM